MIVTETPKRTNEMTAREYAHSLGLAKLGRGRLSPAAKEAIREATANGVVFLPSASERAKAEAELRKAEGRTRKPKATTPVDTVNGVIRGGKFSKDVVKSDYDGKPVHPSVDWYRRTFYVGAYVVNSEGMTMFCISNEPDSEGFTHFVDKTGKKWKAKVNGSWGTRPGWANGGTSAENAA